MTLFSIVRTEHVDCDACEAQAHPAAAMARATGSTISTYSNGDHGARVMRLRPVSA